MRTRKLRAAALALTAALALCACTGAGASSAAPVAAPAYEAVPAPEGVDPLTGLAQDPSQRGSRPVAVMLDNVQAALPQRGVGDASVVYESVTESGITRLMALYPSLESVPSTGPVRSARDQFVQLMLPMGALFVHAGGSTTATQMLALYQWEDKSLNGYVQADVLTLDTERNASIAIEHCWFTSGVQLETAAQKYGSDVLSDATPLLFDFSQSPRTPADGAAEDVYIRFSGYANSRLQYDASSGRYLKWQFGQKHEDGNTGEQLAFDNVLVLFAESGKYDDGVLTKVEFSFGGVGVYLSRGGYEAVRWLKGAPEEPLRIVSADGSETPVEINPGQTYVAVVPLDMYGYFTVSDTPGDPTRPPQ